jgi:hypothetical protein
VAGLCGDVSVAFGAADGRSSAGGVGGRGRGRER